jgi:putative transposase
MKELFNNKYRIKTTRLKKWDYSRMGSYFITICTNNRLFRFGDVINGCVENQTNKNIVLKHWNNLPQYYNNIELGEMVVMPNHIHFIITIVNDDAVVDDVNCCTDVVVVDSIHELNLQSPQSPQSPQPPPPPKTTLPPQLYKRRKMLLSKIIGRLKMQVAKEINAIEQTSGQAFWQRNYYDRIIRDNNEYGRIEQYIKNNPINWEKDKNTETNLYI